MSKTATAQTTTVVAPSIALNGPAPGQAGGQPSVQRNGQALPDAAQRALVRTVIDTHLHLPGMFELTFADDDGTVLSTAGISIGSTISLRGAAADGTTETLLMSGEVTALEAICQGYHSYTIVRGYDLCHRLQRVRRTRTFLNQTDADIATTIANEAGLTLGTIDKTSVTTQNAFVGQCDQTDWEFLSQRASEIGYETGISCGQFYFRKSSSAPAANGTSGGSPATGGSGSGVSLALGTSLKRFLPRVTAGNIPPNFEVRVWDPVQDQVVSQTAQAGTSTATLTGNTPSGLAAKFPCTSTKGGAAGATSGPSGGTTQPGSQAVATYGPAPNTTGYVIYDCAVATGSAKIPSAATPAASGLADRIASTFAEAEGEAQGNTGIVPGAVVTVSGVPSAFCGSWLITNARHVFDLREGGYFTRFVVSGRSERSLLGLASAGRSRPRPPRMPGVYCGVVTNVNDTESLGRVKVTLPWLSPDYETDWSPVVQFGAGQRSGALFLPEVGDEVLVGFEFADPRRAYVIGGIINNNSTYTFAGNAISSAVTTTGQTAAVTMRGYTSPAKNALVFSDTVPAATEDGPPPTPTVSKVTLGTGDQALALAIDQVAGTVTLSCQPKQDGAPKKGAISITTAGPGSTINITASGEGSGITIDGGTNLTLKAQSSISMQCTAGNVSIKGTQVQLN